ncbi:MAG: hypothetical protein LBK72_01415 [Bifidobacteriaceae bacterium]|jgi:hypothetical protein|nr:hypothetical protein [Bifidobacteriaceae bacterium]
MRPGTRVVTDDFGILIRSSSPERTYAVGAPEARVLALCDGSRTLTEIAESVDQLTPLEVEQLLLLLADAGIVTSTGEGAQPKKFDPMHIRLIHIGVDRLARFRGFATIYMRVLVPLAIVAGGAIAALLIAGGGNVVGSLFGHNYLRLSTIPFYLISTAVVGLIHESAHAFAIIRAGGTVFDFGFMLAYFNPAFYVDVTGINRIPRKSTRIGVWVAGLAAQLPLGALGLFFLTVRPPSPGWVLDFVTDFNGVNIAIFLLNSLFMIKLDGYYLLSEMIGVDGLRERSTGYVRRLMNLENSTISLAERGVFLIVGLVSIVYVPLFLVNVAVFGVQHLLPAHLGAAQVWMASFLGVGIAAGVFRAVRVRARARRGRSEEPVR